MDRAWRRFVWLSSFLITWVLMLGVYALQQHWYGDVIACLVSVMVMIVGVVTGKKRFQAIRGGGR